MTREEILSRVTELVSEILEIDDLALTDASVARDIDGWDSISNVEIMVAIEQAFGLRFRTGEIAAFASIGDLVTRIAEHAGA